MLSVSSLAYTTEVMSFYNTLESFSLRSSDYVHVGSIVEQFYGDYVTQV